MTKIAILVLSIISISGWYSYYNERNDKHVTVISDYWYKNDKLRCTKICSTVGFEYGSMHYQKGDSFDKKTCGCEKKKGAATWFKYLQLKEL